MTLLGAPFNVIDPLIVGLPLAIIALVAGIALSTEAKEEVTEAEAA